MADGFNHQWPPNQQPETQHPQQQTGQIQMFNPTHFASPQQALQHEYNSGSQTAASNGYDSSAWNNLWEHLWNWVDANSSGQMSNDGYVNNSNSRYDDTVNASFNDSNTVNAVQQSTWQPADQWQDKQPNVLSERLGQSFGDDQYQPVTLEAVPPQDDLSTSCASVEKEHSNTENIADNSIGQSAKLESISQTADLEGNVDFVIVIGSSPSFASASDSQSPTVSQGDQQQQGQIQYQESSRCDPLPPPSGDILPQQPTMMSHEMIGTGCVAQIQPTVANTQNPIDVQQAPTEVGAASTQQPNIHHVFSSEAQAANAGNPYQFHQPNFNDTSLNSSSTTPGDIQPTYGTDQMFQNQDVPVPFSSAFNPNTELHQQPDMAFPAEMAPQPDVFHPPMMTHQKQELPGSQPSYFPETSPPQSYPHSEVSHPNTHVQNHTLEVSQPTDSGSSHSSIALNPNPEPHLQAVANATGSSLVHFVGQSDNNSGFTVNVLSAMPNTSAMSLHNPGSLYPVNPISHSTVPSINDSFVNSSGSSFETPSNVSASTVASGSVPSTSGLFNTHPPSSVSTVPEFAVARAPLENSTLVDVQQHLMTSEDTNSVGMPTVLQSNKKPDFEDNASNSSIMLSSTPEKTQFSGVKEENNVIQPEQTSHNDNDNRSHIPAAMGSSRGFVQVPESSEEKKSAFSPVSIGIAGITPLASEGLNTPPNTEQMQSGNKNDNPVSPGSSVISSKLDNQTISILITNPQNVQIQVPSVVQEKTMNPAQFDGNVNPTSQGEKTVVPGSISATVEQSGITGFTPQYTQSDTSAFNQTSGQGFTPYQGTSSTGTLHTNHGHNPTVSAAEKGNSQEMQAVSLPNSQPAPYSGMAKNDAHQNVIHSDPNLRQDIQHHGHDNRSQQQLPSSHKMDSEQNRSHISEPEQRDSYRSKRKSREYGRKDDRHRRERAREHSRDRRRDHSKDHGDYRDDRSYIRHPQRDSYSRDYNDRYGDRRNDPQVDPYRDPYCDQRYDSRKGHYDTDYYGRPKSRQGYPEDQYRPRSRQGYPHDPYNRQERPRSRNDYDQDPYNNRTRSRQRDNLERPSSRQGEEIIDRPSSRHSSRQVYPEQQYRNDDYHRREKYRKHHSAYYEYNYDYYKRGRKEEIRGYQQYPYHQSSQSFDSNYSYDRNSHHSHSRGSTPGYDHQSADQFAREFNNSRPNSRQSGYKQSPMYPVDDFRHCYESYDQSYLVSQQTSHMHPPVPEPGPARRTPPRNTLPHIKGSMLPGGMLSEVQPNRPQDGQPATVVLREMPKVHESTDVDIKSFPGPLSRNETHKGDVLRFCQNKVQELSGAVGMIDRESALLMWKYLELLIKQNGIVVGADIADLLMEGHEKSAENMPVSGVSAGSDSSVLAGAGNESGDLQVKVTAEKTVILQTSSGAALDRFRRLCLFGHKKEALEFAMKSNLWEQALFLAMRMGPSISASVTTRYMNSALSVSDPLRTLYEMLSGTQPAACTMVGDERFGDWRPHLAVILSQATERTELDNKSIIAMGDALATKGFLYASQFCYLMAKCHFQDSSKKTAKLVLLGSNHTLPFEQHATNMAIQMTEVYEYGMSLAKASFCIPSFQKYKLAYMTRLVDSGFAKEALHYCEVLSNTILQTLSSYPKTLVQNVAEFGDRLKGHDPQRLQTDEALPDPVWLESIQAVSRQYESGALQFIPTSGSQTPANTPSISDVGEHMQNLHVERQDSLTKAQLQQHNASQQYNTNQPQVDPTQHQIPVLDPHSNTWVTTDAQGQQPNHQYINDQWVPVSQDANACPQQTDVNQAQQYQQQPQGDFVKPAELPSSNILHTVQESIHNDHTEQTSAIDVYGHATQNSSTISESDSETESHDAESTASSTSTVNDVSMHVPCYYTPTQPSDPSTPLGAASHDTEDGDDKPKKKTYWPGEDDEDNDKIMAAAKKMSAEKKKEGGKGFFARIWPFGKSKQRSNEMKLPDDKKPSIVWDEQKKAWVDLDKGEEDQPDNSAPPPKDSDLQAAMNGAGGPPPPSGTPSLTPNRYSRGQLRGGRKGYVDILANNSKAASAAPVLSHIPKSQSVPANIFIPSDSSNSQPQSGSDPAVTSQPQTYGQQASSGHSKQHQDAPIAPPPQAMQFFNPASFQQPMELGKNLPVASGGSRLNRYGS